MAFYTDGRSSYPYEWHGGKEVKASSGGVEVRENFGKNMTAEPSSVPPGGQVTVTYWGAPPSGTGVVGMYGMTRPGKFDLGKRPAGSGSCGSMVWTLPTTPGTYDFRLFEDDINRNLLAQSNSVTVS
jgi:nitrous oxidase accessory protein